MAEVHPGERAEQAWFHPRDLEDGEPAARPQHPVGFGESGGQVRDVPHDKRRAPRVHARVRQRQPGGITQSEARDHAQVAGRALLACPLHHRPRDVEAHDAPGPRLEAREREVARPRPGVEDGVQGAHDLGGGEPAPGLILPDGHHAVHEVVAMRDLAEHLPHVGGAVVVALEQGFRALAFSAHARRVREVATMPDPNTRSQPRQPLQSERLPLIR